MQRGQDVAQGGGLRAGDDGQATREAGQRLLAVNGKNALIFKFGLELQEALEEVALAGPADGFDVELEFAARLVEGNEDAGFDLMTVLQPPAEHLRPASPHDAAHLGAGVLERKVNVTGGGVGQVGDFAADPGQRKGRFEAVPDLSIQAGYAEDGVTDRWSGVLHLSIVTRGFILQSVVDRVVFC